MYLTFIFRLEAIKLQILTKLGLKAKPHVKRTLPRDLVLASLSRAGEDESEPGIGGVGLGSGHMGFASGAGGDPNEPDEDHTTTTDGYADYDDFYGRTSEIITFAEQGYTTSDIVDIVIYIRIYVFIYITY